MPPSAEIAGTFAAHDHRSGFRAAPPRAPYARVRRPGARGSSMPASGAGRSTDSRLQRAIALAGVIAVISRPRVFQWLEEGRPVLLRRLGLAK